MNSDLSQWAARPFPPRQPHHGSHCQLEPLAPEVHAEALWSAIGQHPHLWTYLPNEPPASSGQFHGWLESIQASTADVWFAVTAKELATPLGILRLMEIRPAVGVAEVGSIVFGPRLQRTAAATEAIYLCARHVFEDLGYRRFEWKCDNANEPSKQAAARFGFTFEGLFRQHLVVKGRNRDTAWFSMLDHEWPRLKLAFERWLAPSNFDPSGQQLVRL